MLVLVVLTTYFWVSDKENFSGPTMFDRWGSEDDRGNFGC
jgi:hypothetical protein